MTPTIGRIVLFTAASLAATTAAIVTGVHSDTCIDLTVFHNGTGAGCEALTSVNMNDAPADDATSPSWRWMDYQKAQADAVNASGNTPGPASVVSDDCWIRSTAIGHALAFAGPKGLAIEQVLSVAHDVLGFLSPKPAADPVNFHDPNAPGAV